jgi:ferrochelatase
MPPAPHALSGVEGSIDSVLLIGFGGPESPQEIMPFLRNVVRGRNIPDERLREVEHHYHDVGGRSPYNDWTFKQRDGLEAWLRERGRELPVYVGMRNWNPFLKDVVGDMTRDGARHALGVILSAHQSEVGWERYQDDYRKAADAAGGDSPSIEFLGPWFDHPRFLEANARRLEEATGHRRGAWPAGVPVIFTAHSIPERMAASSPYVDQIRASCQGVARILELGDWELAYQSRSGPPQVPWLEPDVNDVLRRRAGEGVREVAVQSIGFLCDHVEVLYDLDVEAKATCDELGLAFHRAGCVNDHPEFVAMLGELVLQRAAAAETA